MVDTKGEGVRLSVFLKGHTGNSSDSSLESPVQTHSSPLSLEQMIDHLGSSGPQHNREHGGFIVAFPPVVCAKTNGMAINPRGLCITVIPAPGTLYVVNRHLVNE